MKIQIVNPNTSAAMTAKLAAAARRVAAPGTELLVQHSPSGPASIESGFDEALAVPGLLQALAAGVEQGAHGHVIACFGDPGLTAARELARGPVLGIAEAAMHAATLLAPAFSVVTTLQRTVATAERLVAQYGFGRQCRRVRATGIPVLALEHAASDAALYRRIVTECERALDEDGSGAIVLGCAGMADLCERLAATLQVPVIDGVTVAVKLVEALLGAGLATSKRGDYAWPEAKPVSGPMAAFALARSEGAHV
ncbi:MAG TPA: aspartate/glutamate racemase family protein [Ramlibacter sp.]|nr:aspartate/glutamate racemase family protein [Ramlibacter sp.]